MHDRKPYIGITGFTSRDQLESALAAFPAGTNRLLMAGILLSRGVFENVAGSRDNERFMRRYGFQPNKIFIDAPNALNIIHYMGDEPDTIGEQLISMQERFGQLVDGFQINRDVWPDPDSIATYHRNYADKRIILQIQSSTLQSIDCSPRRLAERLKPYTSIVTDVLLDASGGDGKLIDTEALLGYLSALHAVGLQESLGLGIAGGLSAETIGAIQPIVKRFQRISIDCETRVRDAEDFMDMTKVRAYLAEACKLLA